MTLYLLEQRLVSKNAIVDNFFQNCQKINIPGN